MQVTPTTLTHPQRSRRLLGRASTIPSASAIRSAVTGGNRSVYLVDETVAVPSCPGPERPCCPRERTIHVAASESAKSLEALSPLVCRLLEMGIRRDATLVVVGGGTLQDIGCFIASVLFRGIAWELVAHDAPGAGRQLHRQQEFDQRGYLQEPGGDVLSAATCAAGAAVLSTLPWDEIRSGLGEVIKLQLLAGEGGFRELMADLARLPIEPPLLAKWIRRSLEVKKTFIETDEYDQGIRNLLNYGHTFGHAYESATHYAIPHGIAVILGMLTATRMSAKKGLVPWGHYRELRAMLQPWYRPHQEALGGAPKDEIFRAIRMDKKNSSNAINCISDRGFGQMENVRRRPCGRSRAGRSTTSSATKRPIHEFS